MRLTVFILWFVLLAGCLLGQPAPANRTEKAAVQRVKNMLVSSFDRSLPKVSLEFFLRSESEGAPIKWEVNDCGEQAGNPAVDRGRDFPMCVEADIDSKDQGAVAVLVSVGTYKKGPFGVPTLLSVTVTDTSGVIHPVRHLGDLPMEMHRPRPRLPKDPPIPVGALWSLPTGKLAFRTEVL
jgi:hypothetical protein